MKMIFKDYSSIRAGYQTKAAVILAVLMLVLIPCRIQAANSSPLLNKVFVYAGDQKVRLVVLFDGLLDGSDPVPRLQNGTLSLFVRGARGGKPIRQFALGQGGYERLEAREGKSGLWLTVRSPKGATSLKKIPGIALGKSALTVTLPSLPVQAEAVANPPVREPSAVIPPGRLLGQSGSSPSSTQVNQGQGGGTSRTASDLSPDAILERALSNPSADSSIQFSNSTRSAPASPRVEKPDPLRLFPKNAGAQNLFSPSKKISIERPQVGSEVMSLTGMALKFAGALGGILALIMGGFFFFKKLAPSTVSRLGGHGGLVRTLYKTHLAPKKSLAVVEVAGEVLVLGISGQNITMLTKIENEETLARVRQAGESRFVEHLSKMISTHSGEKKDVDTHEPALLGGGNSSNGGSGSDATPMVLPEKGAAALLAYARQVMPQEPLQEKDLDIQDDSIEDEPEAVPMRSADRLRQRLNRVVPQESGSGATR
jgi:flagellar biogenesis protein FliO